MSAYTATRRERLQEIAACAVLAVLLLAVVIA